MSCALRTEGKGVQRMERVIIGTRGSALALWQAHWVRDRLRERYAELDVQVETIVVPADTAPEVPIAQLGTKGVFTKTLEDALLQGRIDIAVHSLKDLASVLPPGLVLAAIPAREDPREALLCGWAGGLAALPHGARIGTSAPRRRAQLLHLRPDVRLFDVRGNVDTRLRKLRDGQFDALLLAAAGLHRLGYHDAISAYLDPNVMLPAAGQGALGIQTRADDRYMRQLTAPLADPTTTACCVAERRVQEILEGGCRAPMGALATMRGHALVLRAMVASEDGAVLIGDAVSGPCDQAPALGERLAARLVARGALEILRMGKVGSGSQESYSG